MDSLIRLRDEVKLTQKGTQRKGVTPNYYYVSKRLTVLDVCAGTRVGESK